MKKNIYAITSLIAYILFWLIIFLVTITSIIFYITPLINYVNDKLYLGVISVSFILIFILPTISLILSIIGFYKYKKDNSLEGKKLSLAIIIISSITIIIQILMILFSFLS